MVGGWFNSLVKLGGLFFKKGINKINDLFNRKRFWRRLVEKRVKDRKSGVKGISDNMGIDWKVAGAPAIFWQWPDGTRLILFLFFIMW